MKYLISAQAVVYNVVEGKAEKTSVGLPTFLLDSNIQGITSAEHAKAIAERVLLSIMPDYSKVSVMVGEMDEPHEPRRADSVFIEHETYYSVESARYQTEVQERAGEWSVEIRPDTDGSWLIFSYGAGSLRSIERIYR